MESVTCLSSCSVVLRYLVSGAGAIHGEFPLRLNKRVKYEEPCDGRPSSMVPIEERVKLPSLLDRKKIWQQIKMLLYDTSI